MIPKAAHFSRALLKLFVGHYPVCRRRDPVVISFVGVRASLGQGVGRVPAYPALSSRPPVDSNSVTSGLAEFDPVLRAPLPQSRLLGLVREIIPPFEGAPSHQQLLISAVSTSSAEDLANFVVVVDEELTSEIQGQRLPKIELSLVRN